jgi:Ca2+-binding RTX toxin-like protein
MATYTVTPSNWNDPAFWSGISLSGAGHTLDLSALGAEYAARYDAESGALVISHGATSFTIGDAAYTATADASLGQGTYFAQFTALRMTGGDDHVTGSAYGEALWLGAGGNDTVIAQGGNDTVTGIDGGDFVDAGGGHDQLSASGGGNRLLGGDGDDTLSAGSNSFTDSATQPPQGGNWLQGGGGNDVITASGGDNTIHGGTGADSITAGAGNDLIAGDSGRDTILGGGGDDTIYGDDGDTGHTVGTLSAFSFDTVSASGDTGTGAVGRFALYDNVGTTDDGTVLQARLTVLEADDPDIAIEFNHNALYLNRDGAADSGSALTVRVEFFDQATGAPVKVSGHFTFKDIDTGAEMVSARSADVTSVSVSANPATNLSVYDSGETLSVASKHTSAGNADQNHWAQFSYEAQQELVFTMTARGVGTNYAFSTEEFTHPPTVIASHPESQDDLLKGGAGNDLIHGIDGADTLIGGEGDDTLSGDAGSDSLSGGDGADTLIGGSGADTMLGEAGDDTFVLSGPLDGDSITGGETAETAGDRIDLTEMTTGVSLSYSAPETGSLSDGHAVTQFSQIERLDLGSGDDSVTGSEGAEVLTTGAGNDLVRAGGGDDSIHGGSGLDSLSGGTGNDSLDGGSDADTLLGGSGNDSLTGGMGDDSLDGGEGHDSLDGGSGADTLIGGAGDDRITAGSGDRAEGGAGDDHFSVSAADVTGKPLTVIGGETGETQGDSLHITGPAKISMTGAESGTVTWLDGSQLSFSEIESLHYTPCFTAGTRLATAEGGRAVEDLRPGMRLRTRDHGLQPLRWIGRRALSAADLARAPALSPVRLGAGALGRGLPRRALLVSPQHRVLLGGPAVQLLFGAEAVLVAAHHLLGRPGITRAPAARGVTYVHLLFDRHELLRSEGVWSESFQPGDRSLAGLDAPQRRELLTLFPALQARAGRAGYSAARPALKGWQARLLAPEGAALDAGP